MDLKVNHSELNRVKTTMVKDAEDLDACVDKLKGQMEILRSIWQGNDADVFCANVSEYFDKMKGLPVSMRAMGKFIDKANGDFQDGDDSFSKELETEVDEYEQQNSDNRF